MSKNAKYGTSNLIEEDVKNSAASTWLDNLMIMCVRFFFHWGERTLVTNNL